MAFTYCTNCGEKIDFQNEKCPFCGHVRGGTIQVPPQNFNQQNMPPVSPLNGQNPQNPNTGGYNPQNPNTGGYNPQNPNTGRYNPQNPNTGGYNPQNPNTGGYNPQNPNTGGYNPQNPNTGGYNPQNPNMGGYNPNNFGNRNTPNFNPFIPPQMPVVRPQREANSLLVILAILNFIIGGCVGIGIFFGVPALYYASLSRNTHLDSDSEKYKKLSFVLSMIGLVMSVIFLIIVVIILLFK